LEWYFSVRGEERKECEIMTRLAVCIIGLKVLR